MFYILFILLLYNKNIFDTNYYVYILDVGQGASNLIVSPKKKEAILIDTGGKVTFKKSSWQGESDNNTVIKNVIQFMKSERIRKIDYAIMTHGDADHVGYFPYLVEHFKIKTCKLNQGEVNYLENNVITNCNIEDNIVLKDIQYRFLKTSMYDNENDNSIVTLLDIYNYKFLFMGDASIKVEEEMMKKYKLHTDFLILGHHGSKTSSSYDFLEFVNPTYGIISAGRNNLYHHPHQEVLDNLNNLHIDILNTQNKGTIQIKINKNGYEINTCMNG